ncbi:bacteriocin transport accessory protein [Paenibacillus polymyxa]|uniref:bacteriocin transport accessory protein n=1 Tax=Paenibacillus polymyxa TaxID=1406 RepID=UPI000737BCD8|nr:bacteriocin transport accessory protein [Paenibacillus polymyxa]
MIRTKKSLIVKITFLLCMCLTSVFVTNDINYAAENEHFTAINENESNPTVEEYENYVKDLPRLNAKETINKFNSGEGFYFYLGRPTCYYCREFSPILKEFSVRISQPIYYYNMAGGDWGPEIRQFLIGHIDFKGTPTLAYIKDGKVVAQQAGTGPNADELLTIFANCPQ